VNRPWIFLIVAMVGLLFLPACGDDGVGLDVGFDEGETGENGPPEVQGYASLENMQNHAGISIKLLEIDISLVTDDSGQFSLISELADGEWTISASYPFFTEDKQSLTIVNGRPENDLQSMSLYQQIIFNVVPDKLEYTYGETVFITLEALNITNEPLTLLSGTSPMAAYAVRHEGQTVVGGLYPGQGAEPQEVELLPEEIQSFTMSWTIDNYELGPGEYQIYAILTNSGQYPEYFSADAGSSELNESLFSKLIPVTVTLLEPVQ